jgi:tetratricopeptide (TPR) repeat protein
MRAAIALLFLAGTPHATLADDPAPAATIEPAASLELVAKPTAAPPAVARLLAQPFLSADERRDLNIRFGIWTLDDLSTPARRARAALVAGAYADASFDDTGTDVLDRVEARIMRGEPAAALELLAEIAVKPDASCRALRLHAQGLVDLGKNTEAATILEALANRLNAVKIDNADELVEGVRGLILRSRLIGGTDADYKAMLSMLTRAREELDRLCWSAFLVEAQLLEDKDSGQQATEALVQALTLNPSCAEAWALSGKIAVDGFSFERAFGAADQLRAWASLTPGGGDSLPADKRPHAVSWRADAIACRAFLRQREAESAAKALAPSLDAFAQVRTIQSLAAAVAAASFDTAKTSKNLEEIDKNATGFPDGYHAVGKTLAEMRQYEDARPFFEEAVRRAPKWSEPWNDLGLMLVQAGRDKDALRALEMAASLDPFNTSVGNSLTLVRELKTYARIESPHYIIRCKPGVDEILANEMVGPLEANYARVTGDAPGGIRFPLPTKTVIELYPDHHWFSVRITGMPQVHTIAAATGPVIAMEAPREGPGHLVGPYDWVRVLRHEFTHTVTLARTKNRLPHWFTEAAAVYLEDAPRDYSACQIIARAVDTDTLFDFEEINNAFVRPQKATDRSQAYAQGHLMYEYIVTRYGPEAPLKLMDQYALGRTEAQAFQSELNVAREDFISDFAVFARQQCERWGMLLPEGTPKFRALLVRAMAEASSLKGAPENPENAAENAPKNTLPDEDAAGRIKLSDADTSKLLAAMQEKYPAHPDVLEAALDHTLKLAGGKPSAAMVPLIERYAAARPVDPLPHKLMATLALTGEVDPASVVKHLQWLDAREQHSPAFTVELARRAAAASDWTSAWQRIERGTQLSPYDATIREQAASIAIKKGDFAAAERQLAALVAFEPDRAQHAKRLEALKQLRQRGTN